MFGSNIGASHLWCHTYDEMGLSFGHGMGKYLVGKDIEKMKCIIYRTTKTYKGIGR